MASSIKGVSSEVYVCVCVFVYVYVCGRRCPTFLKFVGILTKCVGKVFRRNQTFNGETAFKEVIQDLHQRLE